MLEKPDLPDEKIVGVLQSDYGVDNAQIDFLPLGADRNTAVYKAVAGKAGAYFVKLRTGTVIADSITVPAFLSKRGITQIISPIVTVNEQLWTRIDAFTLILYPFIVGQDGYEVALTEHNWIELGTALKAIHTTKVPDLLTRSISHEIYSPQWRNSARMFLKQIADTRYDDPVSAELAAFMRSNQSLIANLLERTEQLAKILRARALVHVLCHGDLHAGNILVGENGTLYIVDWDTLIMAPKEHDLMFPGAGLSGVVNSMQEDVYFYRGYGADEGDRMAIAYYRYERIVRDIAAYCEEILLSAAGGADREAGLRNLMGSFRPGSVVEMAEEADRRLQE